MIHADGSCAARERREGGRAHPDMRPGYMERPSVVILIKYKRPKSGYGSLRIAGLL